MDRPEDIEHNPVNGKVYMVMTNNTQRGTEGNAGTDDANPRPENACGHIIEVTEEGGDHAATTFAWDIFLLCGDPADESTYFAGFPKEKVSKICQPGQHHLRRRGQPLDLDRRSAGLAGGQRRPLRGSGRWRGSRLPAPVLQRRARRRGSGPIFTPDNTTLFAAIQHPGEGGTFDEPVIVGPARAAPSGHGCHSAEDGRRVSG